ncbi:hypothetical protein N7527_004791 [Penicillium freii]|nr:hypothetical protein N7527_004791 [Penicillium freii]
MDAQGWNYGTALQAPSMEAHREIVAPPIASGAKVNLGLGDIIQLLLNGELNFNAKCGLYGSMLQASSEPGCEKIILLI